MQENTDIAALMAAMGRAATAAASTLAEATPEAKAAALTVAATTLLANEAALLAANAEDCRAAEARGLSGPMLDRLRLDSGRIRAIAEGLRAIADLPDPVGAVMSEWDMPSGLHIQRVRTPIGVIGAIFESRPNVTADIGALCLKSGNAVILRGGSESLASSRVIHAAMQEGLRQAGLPEAAIQLVPVPDRAAVGAMLGMVGVIDVIVPRGGKSLVARVQAESRVPVFAHLEGVNHVYLDRDADLARAVAVTLNSKTRRVSVCGAAECLLIHREIIDNVGRQVIDALLQAGVELRGDARLAAIPGVVSATEEDWGREFLDSIMAVRVVEDLDAAISHIRTFGSGHTDCIITESDQAAEQFFRRVDSAILMRNASTQFADGGEFGMGAEVGIATGKLHARGPVGAEQLTSFKYLVVGQGTTRP